MRLLLLLIGLVFLGVGSRGQTNIITCTNQCFGGYENCLINPPELEGDETAPCVCAQLYSDCYYACDGAEALQCTYGPEIHEVIGCTSVGEVCEQCVELEEKLALCSTDQNEICVTECSNLYRHCVTRGSFCECGDPYLNCLFSCDAVSTEEDACIYTDALVPCETMETCDFCDNFCGVEVVDDNKNTPQQIILCFYGECYLETMARALSELLFSVVRMDFQLRGCRFGKCHFRYGMSDNELEDLIALEEGEEEERMVVEGGIVAKRWAEEEEEEMVELVDMAELERRAPKATHTLIYFQGTKDQTKAVIAALEEDGAKETGVLLSYGFVFIGADDILESSASFTSAFWLSAFHYLVALVF